MCPRQGILNCVRMTKSSKQTIQCWGSQITPQRPPLSFAISKSVYFWRQKSLQAVVSHFSKMAKATRGVFRLLLSTARGIPGWGNWTFGLIGGFEPSGNEVSGIGWKPGAFQLQGVVTPWLPWCGGAWLSLGRSAQTREQKLRPSLPARLLGLCHDSVPLEERMAASFSMDVHFLCFWMWCEQLFELPAVSSLQ